MEVKVGKHFPRHEFCKVWETALDLERRIWEKIRNSDSFLKYGGIYFCPEMVKGGKGKINWHWGQVVKYMTDDMFWDVFSL